MLNARHGMFKINRPKRHLQFTGERITTAISGEVEAEHYHRYCFARDFCVDRDVLDIASGEGYGAAILADVARSVVGVELDAEAVAFSQNNYVIPTLSFIVGDALAIPLEDASVDVVVSFETLEHVRDQALFISEIKRVLRPDGLLIISTPDRNIHSGIGMPVNPYHIYELSGPEFDTLLGRSFTSKQILSQRAIAGSVMLRANGAMDRGARTYDRRDDVTIEATDGVARAIYLIGLASDAPLPEIAPSLLAGPRSLGSLWAQIEADAARHAELSQRATEAEAKATEYHREALLREERIAHLTAEIDLQHSEVRRLGELNQDTRDGLEATESQLEAERAECQRLRTLCDQMIDRLQAAERHTANLAAQIGFLNNSPYMKARRRAVAMVLALPGPVQRFILRANAHRRRARRGIEKIGRPNEGVSGHVFADTPTLQLQAQQPATLTGSRHLPSVSRAVAAQFPEVQPFGAFQAPTLAPRVTIVTDSVSASSLFGGVGTSIILGASLARQLKADLRIVTRTEAPDASAVGHVLEHNGVPCPDRLETLFVPRGGDVELHLNGDDVFLCTSWWTTRETLSVVPPDRIVALVQEDERMFYPFGDKRLRCQETLAIPDLKTVVNTRLLFDHLGGDAALGRGAENALWFEPAFPSNAVRPALSGRRKLFFYARPHHARNLFWRGVEAIDAALAEGAFPAEDWQIYFIGTDIPKLGFANGVEPVVLPPMAWGEYQSFIASVDAGFVLMDTPHPSYPPLDIAAAGGAVLTNTHGVKVSLETYSANILAVPTNVPDLVEGLHRLQQLAVDDGRRQANRDADGILRDWTVALGPLVDELAVRLQKGPV